MCETDRIRPTKEFKGGSRENQPQGQGVMKQGRIYLWKREGEEKGIGRGIKYNVSEYERKVELGPFLWVGAGGELRDGTDGVWQQSGAGPGVP